MTDTKSIINEPERVILRGELAEAVMHNSLDYTWDVTADDLAAFADLFTVDETDYIGDPDDSFYQVVTFTRIIRRHSDGKLFGCTFTNSPGNDSYEQEHEQDLDKYGVEVEWDDNQEVVDGFPVVFLPVKEFTRVGFQVVEPEQA